MAVEGQITGLLRILVPPLCVGCGHAVDSSRLVCPDCVRELNRASVIRGDPPAGISVISSCAGHERVARRLLAAYKFRGITGLRGLISGYMVDLAGPGYAGLSVVPVPPDPLRRRLRGFDPVEPLAADVAGALAGARLRTDLLLRRGSGRQRGRGRARRLAEPPDIRPREGHLAGCPGPVLLVDDVVTTGATLTAAARALAACGAGPIRAVTFTRRQ